MTIQLTTDTFDEFIQSQDKVLVDFWAEWCPPCKMMSKTIDALAEESDGEYAVVKVDADANVELAARYQIQSLPTFLVFVDGVLAATAIGAQGKGALKSLVENTF